MKEIFEISSDLTKNWIYPRSDWIWHCSALTYIDIYSILITRSYMFYHGKMSLRFLKMFKSQMLFYKLPIQYQACLYSFECISHSDSNYGNEFEQFWHFLNFSLGNCNPGLGTTTAAWQSVKTGPLDLHLLSASQLVSACDYAHMWHDQGKWITCRKIQFLFSYTTFS